jgi:hypothetical protein
LVLLVGIQICMHLYCGVVQTLPNGYALRSSYGIPGEIELHAPSQARAVVSRLGLRGVAVDGHVAAVAVEKDRYIVVDRELAQGRRSPDATRYFVVDSRAHTVLGPMSAGEVEAVLGKRVSAMRFRRRLCGR